MIKVKDYFIDADTNCYLVKKESGKDKDGKTTYNTLWYPVTLTRAIELIIKAEQRKAVGSNELITLKDAIKQLKDIEEEIKALISNV